MNNTFQVQVVRRGIITLPKELRDQNNIEEGDMMTLIDIGDGVVIMSPRRSRVDEIANKLARVSGSDDEIPAGNSCQGASASEHSRLQPLRATAGSCQRINKI